MRLADVVGVLAALVVGIVVIALVLANIAATPAAAPTPGAPTAPPVATATLGPTDSPSPSPSFPPPPTTTPAGSPAVSPDGEAEPTFPPRAGVMIGQPGPALELPTLDGEVLHIADYRGKPLWINFMATWCPQCRDELPMMERLNEELGDQISMVVVDIGEDRQKVRQFMQSLEVSLPVALDEAGESQAAWGAYALPVHFWLDGEGVVTSILFGGAPPDVFASSIRTVLPDYQFEE
jgi:cytochrome c biogenesis protein CcmG, thiol:disulfide interchange protein DsbE